MANILEAHQALRDGKKVYWHDWRIELDEDDGMCHHQNYLIFYSGILHGWEIEEPESDTQAREE